MNSARRRRRGRSGGSISTVGWGLEELGLVELGAVMGGSFDCMPGSAARWPQDEGALFQRLLRHVKFCKGAGPTWRPEWTAMVDLRRAGKARKRAQRRYDSAGPCSAPGLVCRAYGYL